jgi:hypothetical protein
MPREDSLSSRFDYLFEPLDVEESVDGADTPGGPAVGVTASEDSAPTRMAFAAFVLATLAAVAVVAALLLHRPDVPQTPLDIPAGSTPVPTTVADVSPSVAPRAPAPAPTPAVDQTPRTVETVPSQQFSPEPAQPPRTSAPRAPQGGASISPTTRAPISVAPESRAPFPNQGPRSGDNGGGLLGGLL